MMELSGICREYVVGAETVHALDHVDRHDRRRRVRLDHGPVGLRQVDAAERARPPRPADGGHLPLARRGRLASRRRRARGAPPAAHRLRLPVLPSDSAPDGARERRAAARADGRRAARAARARRRDTRIGRPEGAPRPSARSALGRRAPARRDRPRDHHAAELSAGRRADGQSRHALRRRDHADPRAAESRRHRAPDRDARSRDRRPRAPASEAARRQDRRRRAREPQP